MKENVVYNNKAFDSVDVSRARWQLAYGIRLLQGDPSCGGVSTFNANLVLVLRIQHFLELEGYAWEAERLGNWIHIAQSLGGFVPRSRAALRKAAREVLLKSVDKRPWGAVSESWSCADRREARPRPKAEATSGGLPVD